MVHIVVSLLAILAALACVPRSGAEMFTALVHMEGLLDLEKDLLRGLNEYIVMERGR